MEYGFSIRDRGSYSDCRRISWGCPTLYNLIGRRFSLETGENLICESCPRIQHDLHVLLSLNDLDQVLVHFVVAIVEYLERAVDDS
jgi:hypothetical protein